MSPRDDRAPRTPGNSGWLQVWDGMPADGVRAVILAIALGGCFVFVSGIKAHDRAQLAAANRSQSARSPVVEVITVGKAPPAKRCGSRLRRAGWYSSTIYARVSGYLTRWLVDIGDGQRNIRHLPRSTLQSSMLSSKRQKLSSRLPRQN